ncbi:purK [Symbiodinium microadriaticum]|nr:purK [Symbiodinium microadriaticum]
MSIDPGLTIGILGGGQLARMLALAAAPLGLRTHVYDPSANTPAGQVTDLLTVADYDDEKALADFGDQIDVVTFEFESVPARTAEILADHVTVRPGPTAFAIAQDRLLEKTFLTKEAGVGVAPFAPVDSLADLNAALDAINTPAVLKTRRLGYDGKGQVKISDQKQAKTALETIAHAPAILEGFVPFERELSVIVARDVGGASQTFDVVENIHKNHILDQTLAPAHIADPVRTEAQRMAVAIADALDYVGVLAVELFLLSDGGLLVNEIAPRVHNSGHWTIEACYTSQFEQHMRAVAGLPLGDPGRHSDAIMTNLIGDDVLAWNKLISDDPAAGLHLYGKGDARPGRKMGHITRLYPKGDLMDNQDHPEINRRQFLGSVGAGAAATAVAGGAAEANDAPNAADAGWSNWSGWQLANPKTLAHPETTADLAKLVREASELRVAGAGHSFAPLVPTDGTLISLDRMAGVIEVDAEAGQALVHAGTPISAVGDPLWEAGLSLPNQGDIDKQAIAGAVGTSTHGTGVDLQSFSSLPTEISLMLASGDEITVSAEQDADIFHAARCSLGALGVMTRLRLQCVPRYYLKGRQYFEKIDVALDGIADLAQQNRHAEMWAFPYGDSALVKVLDLVDGPPETPPAPPGAAEDVLLELSAETARLLPFVSEFLQGLVGPLTETTHYHGRAYQVFPSPRDVRFNEMEYQVPVDQGPEALMAIRAALQKADINVFFPLEYRFVKADDALISPFEGRDAVSISVHQYYKQDYRPLFEVTEPVFDQFDGRDPQTAGPHRQISEPAFAHALWGNGVKRRTFLAGAAALLGAGAIAAKPGDQSDPDQAGHDDYFVRLQAALKRAGIARPTMVIDRNRLDQNIATLMNNLPLGLAYRIVAKSLPSAGLIDYVMQQAGTHRLMVFHQPFLNDLASQQPFADVLIGKPMPVAAAKRFYETLPDSFEAMAFGVGIKWLIDSKDRLDQYEALGKAMDAPIRVNLEIDVGLHRGGFTDPAAMPALIDRIEKSDYLSFDGFMGYDAHVAKVPDLMGWQGRSFDAGQKIYGEFLDAAAFRLGQEAVRLTTRNAAGSPTYQFYKDSEIANEVSVGSALVKPTDFDIPTLTDHIPAAFIATPVLKKSGPPQVPALEALTPLMRAWDPNQAQTFFIYGGYWKAKPVSPKGLAINPVYGRSTNQEMLNGAARIVLDVDDFVFLRPTQSEFVFLQFGDLAVFDGEEITDFWPVLDQS